MPGKSMTTLKSLEKQDVHDWPTVNLLHGMIKDKGDERLLKTGVALNNTYMYMYVAKSQMHLLMGNIAHSELLFFITWPF